MKVYLCCRTQQHCSTNWSPYWKIHLFLLKTRYAYNSLCSNVRSYLSLFFQHISQIYMFINVTLPLLCCLELLISIGRDGQFQTYVYDKRDDFQFHITNFPFPRSNITFRPLLTFHLTIYAICLG